MTAFTTSWDDGHPLDARLADLLAEHGFCGTFYVPHRNSEGRPVLSGTELRRIADRFEIGSHTRDHVRLDRLPARTVEQQIRDGRRSIEDELGKPVSGFCYPGGVHTAALRRAVRSVGFTYARTITNFCIAPPEDRFRVPTTIQLYPHRRVTFVKNFVRGGEWSARALPLAETLRARSLDDALRALLERTVAAGGVFHLWGHSWEIEEQGLWPVLARFLEFAATLIPPAQRTTNHQLYA
jgi:peptidoglycan/xylan/chitin deacetylase (PgdA/CDA1 family)